MTTYISLMCWTLCPEVTVVSITVVSNALATSARSLAPFRRADGYELSLDHL